MTKVKSFTDLQILRTKYREEQLSATVPEGVQIKVGMATCGIASGAGEILKFLTRECEHQAIDAKIKQTGCLGYCYAEPMVEVQLAGEKPVVFGYVDKVKAREIIEKYIVRGEKIEGVIPISFQTIND